MKKYLLPKSGSFYKANLHCHSTVSDGKLTPEELKKIYKEKGYSVIAYTDHDVLVPHSELADDTFLPLNGYEIEINEDLDTEYAYIKTCHLCLIAIKHDNFSQVCYHRTKYLFGNAVNYRGKVKFDSSLPDYERVYTADCINDIIKKGREGGFFVTYNHPTWSTENYEYYSKYSGMNAMEICNYGCVAEGYPEYNERVYDDMLKNGERIFCIGADDNHNRANSDSRKWDSFGAFTMIKADKLDYETITDALVNGNFYASQGPEIYDLWYENGKVGITCSEADKIVYSTACRKIRTLYKENAPDGNSLTEAVFKVNPEDKFFRITVTDEKGNHANTNAYFTDELF